VQKLIAVRRSDAQRLSLREGHRPTGAGRYRLAHKLDFKIVLETAGWNSTDYICTRPVQIGLIFVSSITGWSLLFGPRTRHSIELCSLRTTNWLLGARRWMKFASGDVTHGRSCEPRELKGSIRLSLFAKQPHIIVDTAGRCCAVSHPNSGSFATAFLRLGLSPGSREIAVVLANRQDVVDIGPAFWRLI
jgi:hypothetical protein